MNDDQHRKQEMNNDQHRKQEMNKKLLAVKQANMLNDSNPQNPSPEYVHPKALQFLKDCLKDYGEV
eukprot:46074-Rhodomonas_salina.1